MPMRSRALDLFVLWALLGSISSTLKAQIGPPVEVTYKKHEIGEFEFQLDQISFKTDSGNWVLEFSRPQSNKPLPGVVGKIQLTDPEGNTGVVHQDPKALGIIWDELTWSFSSPPHWTKPWVCSFPGSGQDLYLCEQQRLGDWQVFRVLWHIGGLSGPPPMPFIFVALHRESGKWWAFASGMDYPPTPSRGNAMNLSEDDGGILITWWQAHTPNVHQLRGTKLTFKMGEIAAWTCPTRYSLFTNNGAVSSLASTPREAARRGWLEAAWRLKKMNERGGVAMAEAPSPRVLVSPEDAEGAPILPAPGSRSFVWARELFVVPWVGKSRKLPLRDALDCLKRGRWGVVLFPLGGKSALAGRVIEFPPKG